MVAHASSDAPALTKCVAANCQSVPKGMGDLPVDGHDCSRAEFGSSAQAQEVPNQRMEAILIGVKSPAEES